MHLLSGLQVELDDVLTNCCVANVLKQTLMQEGFFFFFAASSPPVAPASQKCK